MNIIPEIGHFKVACDTVSVVSNCIMGLFWGRYPFFSDCDVVWETGTKFVPQNIPIVQFESHGQSQGRSLKKNFIYQIKTSLRPSCDRCDPVCDTSLRNQFHMIVMTVQFAGLFPAILANIWTLDVHYTTIFLLD